MIKILLKIWNKVWPKKKICVFTVTGTYKVRNEIETKRNQQKRNEINEMKRNQRKQNEIN